MPYDPMPTQYLFPEITDEHYLPVKHKEDIDFNEDYPYVDYSFSYRLKESLMRILTVGLAFPVMRTRCLLKVEGRENLKKHRDVIKNGLVSVVNHVFIWDFIAIMYAVRGYRPWIPVWDVNMRGENRKLIRYNRGIPLPTESRRATAAFAHALDRLLSEEKQWVHFSAEGSMWEYYMPIRPFKKGAFTFAVRNGKPVLPMAFSYRKPKGWQKIFWRRPLLTLHIGEPIFPDLSLNKVQATEKLAKAAHAEVCRLAGIDPEENIYEPIFNNSKRIDYYTDTYGVKKKYF